MKNSIKITLFLVILLSSLCLIPTFSCATSTSVDSEAQLIEAIQNIENGEVITLSNNIALTTPLEISNTKSFTINGDGHTISRETSSWHTSSANGSLLSIGANTTVTLSNMTLENSQKYGVQAYNGGYVILDEVKIQNCGYGGVLANAGTVEVRSLYLGHNGREDSNNGIEIAKSETISGSENNPKVVMNGTLDTDQTVNVVYVDINDPIATFTVENTDNTVNKIFLNGNQLVVTDQNNNILYTSNSIEGIDIAGEGYTPPEPVVEEEPTVQETLEKDPTPKTGVDTSFGLALIAIAISIFVISILRKDN